MIQAYYFNQFGSKQIGFNQIEKNRLTLVRSINPSAEELEKISKLLKISIEEMKEYWEDIKEEARPRIIEDDYFLIMFKAPFHEDEDDTVTAPVAIFIKNKIVVILHKERINSVEYVIKAAKNNKLKFLYKKSLGYFLYYIVDKINDEFLYILNKIADKSEILKEKSKDLKSKEIENLDALNTTLIHFNRALLGNAEVLTLLKKGYFKGFRGYDKQHFTELYLDALQLLDTEKIQRDVITGFFNFQSALSSYKLNILMKRITSLALIIMVPTFLTGLYGMNVVNLPFAQHEYGFFIISAFMFVIAVGLLWLFNKLEWV